jgi:hypothetical protein
MHCHVLKDYYLLECDVYSGFSPPTFRRNVLLSYSGLKSKPIKQAHLGLKMEAVRSSKMSMNFYQTTRCYILEDITLHSHHFENFISHYSILAVKM